MIQLLSRWNSQSKYCTSTPGNYEFRPKTITEKFTASMRSSEEQKKLLRERRSKKHEGTSNLLKPFDGYTPRFQYNGYLKKTHWKYYDEQRKNKNDPETEAQYNYKLLKKQKFCLLMGFAGGNYCGMQYNPLVKTIEGMLFPAMAKNGWILKEHINEPWLVDFQRTSRTDRGVSAARQTVALTLRKFESFFEPKNV